MSDPALVRFIRDVLGCGCPDEVLESITVERGLRVPALDVAITRIDVGGRLLVYVIEVAGAESLDSVIGQGLTAGVADRDGDGFNRFRLVLATADPSAIEAAAREAFEEITLPDDRVHVHVVAADDLPLPGKHLSG